MREFILTALLGLGLSFGAYAQSDEEALLPDLDSEETVNQESIQAELSVPADLSGTENTDLVSKETEVLVEEETQPSSVEENVEEEVVEAEEEEDKEKKIYLTMADVKSTLAPVRAVSYCSGAFVMYNDTNKTVEEFSGTFTFGDRTQKFKFQNVKTGDRLGWKFQIVGTACESIMKMPDIQFDKCQIKGLSKDKCLEKLVFIPISK